MTGRKALLLALLVASLTLLSTAALLSAKQTPKAQLFIDILNTLPIQASQPAASAVTKYEVTFTVTTPWGNPAASAYIYVCNASPSFEEASIYNLTVASGLLNGSGMITLKLPSGRYTAIVRGIGAGGASNQGFIICCSFEVINQSKQVTINAAEKTYPVLIRVVNPPDDRPITSQADIIVYMPSLDLSLHLNGSTGVGIAYLPPKSVFFAIFEDDGSNYLLVSKPVKVKKPGQTVVLPAFKARPVLPKPIMPPNLQAAGYKEHWARIGVYVTDDYGVSMLLAPGETVAMLPGKYKMQFTGAFNCSKGTNTHLIMFVVETTKALKIPAGKTPFIIPFGGEFKVLVKLKGKPTINKPLKVQYAVMDKKKNVLVALWDVLLDSNGKPINANITYLGAQILDKLDRVLMEKPQVTNFNFKGQVEIYANPLITAPGIYKVKVYVNTFGYQGEIAVTKIFKVKAP